MAKKPMTLQSASMEGYKQACGMVSMTLIDKLDMGNDDIAEMMSGVERLAQILESDSKVLDRIVGWTKENNLYISFTENQSFMNVENRVLSEVRIGLKTNTIVHMIYVLSNDMNIEIDRLLKLKDELLKLQDVVNQKYITYQDIYDIQSERGIQF